jgi:tetratricopeptide (TPR) repeat protein
MFKGIDTGSGEPIVNGDLYQNGFVMVLHGFSFQSVSLVIPDAENMTTPNTTIYWIEKAFANPSKSQAIANLNKIIKTNPKDAWAWLDLGLVLSTSGRYDESIDAVNESIKLDPYFSSAWDQKGFVFYKLKKYDNALEAYEKAIQLDPGDGLYWIDKSDALNALGRTTEADAAYDRALELEYDSSTWTSGTTTMSPSATPGTNILDHSMASNVDESTYNVTTRANIFSSTDSKVYSWLSLGNVGAGKIEWMWYSPKGNLYQTDSVDIPTPSGAYWSSYNVWDHIDIAGNIPAELPGNWYVDISQDGQKLLTERFTMFLR